jgi:hypothetical protein
MIWVTWRQHRGQAIGSLALLCGLALILLLVSGPMRTSFSVDRIARCAAAGVRTDSCVSTIQNGLVHVSYT